MRRSERSRPSPARRRPARQAARAAPRILITNQYKQWFTVASIPGCELQTTANYDFGQSKPNYVMTYFSCNAGSTADVTFTFTQPARKITFKGIGINGTKGVALMKLTHADGSASEASLDGAMRPKVPSAATRAGSVP